MRMGLKEKCVWVNKATRPKAFITWNIYVFFVMMVMMMMMTSTKKKPEKENNRFDAGKT